MFFKVVSKVKDFYFIPAIILMPIKGIHGGYEEYIKCKNEETSLIIHTLSSAMGIYTGAWSGVILGLMWPITIPVFIGRYLDNNKK